MSDFFINNAYAQAAQPAGGGGVSLFMMGLLFVVFYFFLIRPQLKQQKEHRQMVSELAKGDEVVTSGGMLGKIVKIGDNFLVLEVASNVEVKIQKHAVSATLPKGTIKTL